DGAPELAHNCRARHLGRRVESQGTYTRVQKQGGGARLFQPQRRQLLDRNCNFLTGARHRVVEVVTQLKRQFMLSGCQLRIEYILAVTEMHPRGRALDDGLPRGQTTLIDADVIVRNAFSHLRLGDLAGRNGGDLDAFRSELHVQRAGHRGAVLRLHEEHPRLLRRGLGALLCGGDETEPGDDDEDRQRELLSDFHERSPLHENGAVPLLRPIATEKGYRPFFRRHSSVKTTRGVSPSVPRSRAAASGFVWRRRAQTSRPPTGPRAPPRGRDAPP